MDMTARLEEVKSIIRSLLISTQKNMRVLDLCRDYQESEGKAMPYHELGYTSTVEFLKSLRDTVVVTQGPPVGGKACYYVRPLVSQSTKHMEDLVIEQENKSRKKRMPRRPRGISSHERYRGRSSPPLRTTFNQQRSSSNWSSQGSRQQAETPRVQDNFRNSSHEPDRVQDNFRSSSHEPDRVPNKFRNSSHEPDRVPNNFRSSSHEPVTVQNQSSYHGPCTIQNNFRGSYHDPDEVELEPLPEQNHRQTPLRNLADSQEEQRVSAFIPTKVFHASNATKLQPGTPEFVPRKSDGGAESSENQRMPQTSPFRTPEHAATSRPPEVKSSIQQVQFASKSSSQTLPPILTNKPFPLQAGIMSTVPSPEKISYSSYLLSSMSKLMAQQCQDTPKEEPKPVLPSSSVVFQDSGFKSIEKLPEERKVDQRSSPVPDYNPDCGVHEKVVKKVVNLLQLYPEGIQAIELLSTYKRHYKAVLDYSGYGFNSVMEMVSALKNHITAKRESDFSDFTLLSKTSPIALEYQKQQQIVEEKKVNQIPLKVQERTKRLLEDFRKGLKAKDFAFNYKSYFNEELNHSSFGYSSMDAFLTAMDNKCLLAKFDDGEISVYPLLHTQQEEQPPRPLRRQYAPVQPGGTMQCGDTLPPFQWPQQAGIDSEVDIKIEFVQSPFRFFYTFCGQSRRDLVRMMLDMTDHYTHSDVDLSIRKMYKDLLVVTSYENVLHRAQILRVLDDLTCVVYCVDFGNMFVVRRENLYYLLCKYATIPAQAQLGALFNLVPIDCRNDWADTDTATLFHMVNHSEPLTARIKQVDMKKGCATLTIYTRSKGRPICVNNEMVRLGVAEFYDEKYIPDEPVTTYQASAQQYPTAAPAFGQQQYTHVSRVPSPVKPLSRSVPSFVQTRSSTPQTSLVSQHHNSQTGWYPNGSYTAGLPRMVPTHIPVQSPGRSIGSYSMDNEVAALTSQLQHLQPRHTAAWYPAATGSSYNAHHTAALPGPELRDTPGSDFSHYSELCDSEDGVDNQQEQAMDRERVYIVAAKWGRETVHIVNYQGLAHLLWEEVATLLKCGSGAALRKLTMEKISLNNITLHKNDLPALFQQINNLQLGAYMFDQQVQLLPLRTLGVVLSLVRNEHVNTVRSELMRHLMNTMSSFNANDPCWFA